MTVSWFPNKQSQQPGEQGGEQVAPQAAQAGELASRWIGQRRYLAHLPYVLPRDAPEAHRLDFQHFYLRALLKGLHLVPLPAHRLHEVLDVGCGTGRWVHEMA
ncbi:MAG TPA: hypothetical protein VFV38_07985, partial [Ktedonobacteraceae bacterium]|nr:hypothetical protein [Ktedonobacteraceae bacterium]